MPPVHRELGFVLSAMAGHLFGYEAALVIDVSAHPLRAPRAAIQEAARRPTTCSPRSRPRSPAPARTFLDALRAGGYDGNLEAGTAVQLASLFRYATRDRAARPLRDRPRQGRHAGRVVDDLTAALTAGIEELTRTIDTIKHQAKTVTVGISRADEELLQVPLVRAVLAAGATPRRAQLPSLRTLVALDPAVVEVTGLDPLPHRGRPRRRHRDDPRRRHARSTSPSRTATDPTLRGTKHRVATQREVTVARGRSDGRTLVFVPEVKGNETVGLTLLHVRFAERLPRRRHAHDPAQGYQGRYGALKDAVTETVPSSTTTCSATFDVVELLTEPVYVLADRWPTGVSGAILGLGTDLVEVDRFRLALARRRSSLAGRLFSDDERGVRRRQHDPGRAWRRASRPRRQ